MLSAACNRTRRTPRVDFCWAGFWPKENQWKAAEEQFGIAQRLSPKRPSSAREHRCDLRPSAAMAEGGRGARNSPAFGASIYRGFGSACGSLAGEKRATKGRRARSAVLGQLPGGCTWPPILGGTQFSRERVRRCSVGIPAGHRTEPEFATSPSPIGAGISSKGTNPGGHRPI